jgi:hypothetical protein
MRYNNMNKRGYFVHNNDEDMGGFAVVATTAKEAKKIVYDSGEIIFGDTDYIAIRARWVRDADVKDLPIGMVADERDALIRGLYGWLDEYPCDECRKDADVTCYSGRALCSCCIEKEYAKEDAPDSKSTTP